MRTPTYAGGIEATRPGCATGKHRVNNGNATPLQATDSAILAGFNGAYARTMGGGMCYLNPTLCYLVALLHTHI